MPVRTAGALNFPLLMICMKWPPGEFSFKFANFCEFCDSGKSSKSGDFFKNDKLTMFVNLVIMVREGSRKKNPEKVWSFAKPPPGPPPPVWSFFGEKI